MAMSDVADALTDEKRPRSEKYIAIYIAALAVILSLASVAAGNSTKDGAKANLDAANLWAFFQAKNIRRTQYALAADRIEAELAAVPGPSPDMRAMLMAQLSDYRTRVARYKSEPDKQEGLKELIARARAKERERDIAMQRDPYFDYAQALLQIAIVLASVAIIAGGSLSLVASIVVALVGVAALANGYTLAVDVEPMLANGIGALQAAMSNGLPSATK